MKSGEKIASLLAKKRKKTTKSLLPTANGPAILTYWTYLPLDLGA